MKLKRLIAAAGLATVLAIGVGTGITINREAERVDATIGAGELVKLTKTADIDETATYVLGLQDTTTKRLFTGVDKISSNSNWGLTSTTRADAAEFKLKASTTANEFTASYVDANLGKKYIGFMDSLKFGVSDTALKMYLASTGAITNNYSKPSKSFKLNISSSNKIRNNYSATEDENMPYVYFYKAPLDVTPRSSIDVETYDGFVGDPNVTLTVKSEYFTPTSHTWTIADNKVVDFVTTPGTNDSSVTIKLIGAGTTTVNVEVTDGKITPIKLKCTFTLAQEIPAHTISDVKDNVAIGNNIVKVTGVVADINGKNLYIADPSNGRAIAAYDIDKYLELKVGDEVLLSGTIGVYPKGSTHKQLQGGKLIGQPLNSNVKVNAQVKTLDELTDDNYSDIVTIKDLNVREIIPVKDKNDIHQKVVLTNGVKNLEYFIKQFKQSTKFDGIENDLRDSIIFGNKVSIFGPFDMVKSVRNISVTEKSDITFGVNDEGLTLAANRWAKSFVDTLAKECGTTYVLSEATWNAQAAKFNELSDADKAVFKSIVADKNGTVAQKAVSSHNYVVTKYAFTNFIGVAGLVAQNNNMIVDNTNMIITIVVISTIAISAIALLVIFKRRKATR